ERSRIRNNAWLDCPLDRRPFFTFFSSFPKYESRPALIRFGCSGLVCQGRTSIRARPKAQYLLDYRPRRACHASRTLAWLLFSVFQVRREDSARTIADRLDAVSHSIECFWAV